MGEMASSVAHELNQPLTAIANYCNGMISPRARRQHRQRVADGGAGKKAKQADRAARSFTASAPS